MPVSAPDPKKEAAATQTTAPKLSGPARAMAKLGLKRDIDLALHLPMRYVDETRLRPWRSGSKLFHARVRTRPQKRSGRHATH